MSNWAVGMKFSSYDEFKRELQKYCDETFHEFWKRDAKCLKSASSVKRYANANPALQYFLVKMCCIKGGRPHKRSKDYTGRRKSTTWREGCPAYILLKLSKDGQFLEVSALNLNHTHETSETLHKMLPKHRRLPEDVQKEAAILLKLGVNSKILAQKLSRENHKTVLVKDLRNIAAKLKNSLIDLSAIVETLQNTHSCVVNILQKDNVLEGLFFQDEKMQNSFQSFPDILFFSGTYKLKKIGFICYIFMVEDSNGSSEVVGVGLLAKEDRTSVEWLVDAFKERNETTKTQAIITDKDFVERDIFKEKFPDAAPLICLFNTLRAFRCEIDCEKYGLKENLKCSLIEYFQQLAYSCTEEEYFQVYQKFSSVAPASFMVYYNEKWHPIRNEWTRMICSTGSYMNSTNNQLECFNSEVETVIASSTSLSVFVDKFFLFLRCRRNEPDSENVEGSENIPTDSVIPENTKELYSKLLIPYAYKCLLKQMETLDENTVQKIGVGNYNYKYEDRSLPTNYNACSCAFFLSMKLPCKHILATRCDMGLCLYDEDLCDERWKRNNVKSSKSKANIKSNPLKLALKVVANAKTLHQKYLAASLLTTELAQIISEASNDIFKAKMEQISELLRCWKGGQEVALVSVETFSDVFTSSSAAPMHETESEEHLQLPTVDSDVSDLPQASIHERDSEEPTADLNVNIHQENSEEGCVSYWWDFSQLHASKENLVCMEPERSPEPSACIIRLEEDLPQQNSEPEVVKMKTTSQKQDNCSSLENIKSSTSKSKKRKSEPINLTPLIAAALSYTQNDIHDSYGKCIADEIRTICDVQQQRMLKLKIQQLIYYAHKGLLQEEN